MATLPNNPPPRVDKIQDVTYSGYISRLVLLLVCCVKAACFDQMVAIRLVNVTNAAAVSNQHIYVSGISATAGMKEADEGRKLISKPFSAVTL